MLDCASIRQKIANIEYGFNPASLVVLVPGLSLIVQKIQSSQLLDTLRANYSEPAQASALLASREYAKLDTVFKYHVTGSFIQTIFFAALSALHPLFVVPTLLAAYGSYSAVNSHHLEIIMANNRLSITQ